MNDHTVDALARRAAGLDRRSLVGLLSAAALVAIGPLTAVANTGGGGGKGGKGGKKEKECKKKSIKQCRKVTFNYCGIFYGLVPEYFFLCIEDYDHCCRFVNKNVCAKKADDTCFALVAW